MLGITGIPAVVELLLLPFFPESPRYMLIQRGDEKTAKKALQRLRGWEDVDAELSEMRLEDQSEKAEGHLSVLSLLSQRSLRWQLVSIIVMNMGQQLSGVNAVSQDSLMTTLIRMQHLNICSVFFTSNVFLFFLLRSPTFRSLFGCNC